jgi:hypothetical protein
MERGAKAYRIPAMPEKFSCLLKECLSYAPSDRPVNLNEVATSVCDCYEEAFGEMCPVALPDLELTSADSLNNRAVSKYDLNQDATVQNLLDAALEVDSLHPEANFNKAWLAYVASGIVTEMALSNLASASNFDLGDYRPHLYRACLLNLQGKPDSAKTALTQALHLCASNEKVDLERLWSASRDIKLNLILAPPISGEDLALDAERFWRLMSKCKAALDEKRLDDATRYILMSGDISGYARHPQRRNQLNRMQKLS